MTLIKSISGMRGTLGGIPGNNLTPVDIVEFTSAYATLLREKRQDCTVVIGRDGRVSGPQVAGLVTHTLSMMGVHVIDLGLSTTPTVEMEVAAQGSQGGIIITASHNDMRYNALKFLNDKGEFISKTEGQRLIDLAKEGTFTYITSDQLGTVKTVDDAIGRHIQKICDLDTVDVDIVKTKTFTAVVDCINSTGNISIPPMLDALGCRCILINEEISGEFAHNPEPLAHNLTDLTAKVLEHKADIGIAVDPDVDRLAFVDEKGQYCGEEYTLVMVAKYLLGVTPGPTVSNLSSTKALMDVTKAAGQEYYAAAVGEVNVVTKMKEAGAVIGGEGNGGIIYPTLHAGRDALVGIALLLTALAKDGVTLSEYRSSCPDYIMTKDKIQLTPEMDVDGLLEKVAMRYADHDTYTQDGVKIYIRDGWAHLRKSNTEPIIRLYTEGRDEKEAEAIALEVKEVVTQWL